MNVEGRNFVWLMCLRLLLAAVEKHLTFICDSSKCRRLRLEGSLHKVAANNKSQALASLFPSAASLQRRALKNRYFCLN